jgi:hypothetical protein
MDLNSSEWARAQGFRQMLEWWAGDPFTRHGVADIKIALQTGDAHLARERAARLGEILAEKKIQGGYLGAAQKDVAEHAPGSFCVHYHRTVY